MDTKYKKQFGTKGENLAADFLQEKGYQIIAANYRYGRSGEIDIIARKENLVLFCEVKTRHSKKFGGARYSISKKKCRSLEVTANQYISQFLYTEDNTYRFDLIAIEDGSIEWIEDILR